MLPLSCSSREQRFRPGTTCSLCGRQLFRRDEKEIVFDKQAYVNPPGSRPAGTLARFTMRGIAPGDYVLLAWPTDAQIEYEEPESMRQYLDRGKIIHVAEDAKIGVVIDSLLDGTHR